MDLELVTIGQFSNISMLSIKALRLYDELKLLAPAFIDPRNGYRYYEPAQASRARAIALLRSLEISLLDIRELLAETDADKLRAKLEQHRTTLESRLKEHRYMLRRVEQLMKRGELVSYEIKIKEIEPTRVVGMVIETTPEGISTDSPPAYHRLYEHLGHQGVPPAGPARMIYHDLSEDGWRVEPCVPLAGEIRAEDGIEVHDVPGGRAATTLHVGPYDELGIAWEELRKWFTAQDHRTAAQPYDVYLNDPGQVEPSELQTELVWPIH